MRTPKFCLCKNKGADQFRSNYEADQHLCFRYTDSTVSTLFFLNPKFQASSLLLCRPVCVRPGRKPRRLVSTRRGSNGLANMVMIMKNIGVFWIVFRLNML